MIKGINHQIVEITDTDNRYYERALLVLRPEYASISREILKKEVKKILNNMDTFSTAKPKSVFLKRFLRASLFCAMGSAITALVFILI